MGDKDPDEDYCEEWFNLATPDTKEFQLPSLPNCVFSHHNQNGHHQSFDDDDENQLDMMLPSSPLAGLEETGSLLLSPATASTHAPATSMSTHESSGSHSLITSSLLRHSNLLPNGSSSNLMVNHLETPPAWLSRLQIGERSAQQSLTLYHDHHVPTGGGHRCSVCNMRFATGNALGGHMSSHAKRRKLDAIRVGSPYTPTEGSLHHGYPHG